MKTILLTALVSTLQGCAGFWVVSEAIPADAPPAAHVAATVVDAAILLRAWELIGVFK